MSKRGSPSGSSRRVRRFFATSDSTRSRLAPQTASIASSRAPPAKTAKRAKSCCSSGVEQLVAPVERRPQRPLALGQVARRRRSGAPGDRRAGRGSPAGRGSASRAAASSIASGSPSSRAQIAATAPATLLVERRTPDWSPAPARRRARSRSAPAAAARGTRARRRDAAAPGSSRPPPPRPPPARSQRQRAPPRADVRGCRCRGGGGAS